jgi:hypothetical protein
MMSDPSQWEKWRYIDAIHDYNSMIEELKKMYEQKPGTNRYIRYRIESEMKEAKRDWQKLWLNMTTLRNTRQGLQ